MRLTTQSRISRAVTTVCLLPLFAARWIFRKFAEADSSSRNSSPQEDKPSEYVRLSEDQYEALERQLTGPTVTTATTELQAGYQLGVQDVLRKLRAGYVVGR